MSSSSVTVCPVRFLKIRPYSPCMLKLALFSTFPSQATVLSVSDFSSSVKSAPNCSSGSDGPRSPVVSSLTNSM